MNALILSAILGVIMMFSGIVLKQKSTDAESCHCRLVLLLIVNILEMYGNTFFQYRY